MLPKIGEMVFVESYKHDGSFHRAWSKALVIDVTDEYIATVTDHCWVVEKNKRRWLTKEPAICFFYFKRWYNVISMIRKSGIYFYCNIASPSLYDGEAIKNIDYDLDVKVFPDFSYTVLDENEYKFHSNKMEYGEELKAILEKQLKDLIKEVENKEKPFDYDYIQDYLKRYFELSQEK